MEPSGDGSIARPVDSRPGVDGVSAPPWLLVAGDFVRTGGMDAANHALAAHLARSGRETHLVAHRVDEELAGTRGIEVHRVRRPLGSHLLGFPLLSMAGARAASRLGDDAHSVANGGNFPGRDACWLHYVHAAYRPTVAGRPLRRMIDGAARRMALADERRVASRARIVLCNSELTARHAVELLGAEPDRVHTVYYGTDADRFRPPSIEERDRARAALGIDGDRPALAFVGALGDRRKGFDTLFAACGRLAADPAWDAVLLVVGTGAELERWKARAAAGGMGERVRFLGFRAEVREVLSACDALVSPTRYEAYGLAIHEAMSMGLPAIVSRDAGVAERIPHALDGLLLDDPEDVGELAERLRGWRAGMEAHRAAAMELSGGLRGWTWDHMAARIVDIVEGAG